MIIKLHSLKGESKLKIHPFFSNIYDQLNYMRQNNIFPFEEKPFAEKVQDIGFVHHKVLLLMKLPQIITQVKLMKVNNYYLYYTVIKSLIEKEKDDKHEISEDLIQAFYLV